jgi:hypothetical protein
MTNKPRGQYVASQKLPPDAPLVSLVPSLPLGTATNARSCVVISPPSLDGILFRIIACYPCLESRLMMLITQHGASPAELYSKLRGVEMSAEVLR